MGSVGSILAGVPIRDVMTVRQSLPRLRGVDRHRRGPPRRGEPVGGDGAAGGVFARGRRGTVRRAGDGQPTAAPPARGQAELLAGMGVSERTVGAPARSSMEVERVGFGDGLPVMVDRLAWRADGIASDSPVLGRARQRRYWVDEDFPAEVRQMIDGGYPAWILEQVYAPLRSEPFAAQKSPHPPAVPPPVVVWCCSTSNWTREKDAAQHRTGPERRMLAMDRVYVIRHKWHHEGYRCARWPALAESPFIL